MKLYWQGGRLRINKITLSIDEVWYMRLFFVPIERACWDVLLTRPSVQSRTRKIYRKLFKELIAKVERALT